MLLYYVNGVKATFNTLWMPLPQETADKWYRHRDEQGRYNLADLSARKPGGDTLFEFHGARPPTGRYWAYSRENMERMWDEGRIVIRASGKAYCKRYLHESKGVQLQDLWTDIDMLRGISSSKERLGFPTQKPVALLERIIEVSSDEGDTVLDPFCGCGTTIDAAQKLGRRWIGIDITHLAIGLIKHRLADTYGPSIVGTYKVIGEPTDVGGAEQLASDDPFQFQAWALGLVGARVSTSAQKGADQGIDGRLYFHDEGPAGKTKLIVLSVKAGHAGVAHVRDLIGVMQRESADIGALLSMHEATEPMRKEAASAGFYRSPAIEVECPRVQLLSIKGLLAGSERLQYPSPQGNVTFRRAPRRTKAGPGEQSDLGL